MMILHAKNGTVEVNDITERALAKIWATKDVPAELARMHLWLLAHPAKRPVYFWTFVKNWMRKAPDVIAPAAPQHAGWWRSDEKTLAVGAMAGIAPRAGEEMAEYRKRISLKMAQHRAN